MAAVDGGVGGKQRLIARFRRISEDRILVGIGRRGVRVRRLSSWDSSKAVGKFVAVGSGGDDDGVVVCFRFSLWSSFLLLFRVSYGIVIGVVVAVVVIIIVVHVGVVVGVGVIVGAFRVAVVVLVEFSAAAAAVVAPDPAFVNVT